MADDNKAVFTMKRRSQRICRGSRRKRENGSEAAQSGLVFVLLEGMDREGRDRDSSGVLRWRRRSDLSVSTTHE